MKRILGGVLLVLAATQAFSAPMTELWREDLVNVQNGPQYHATAVVLDDEDNLFVGGGQSSLLNIAPGYPTPFVAKFSPSGVKLWECWLTPYLTASNSFVDGLASDMNGGVFAACREETSAFRLIHINSWGRLWGDAIATNYAPSSGSLATAAGMASDQAGGFYLSGISRETTNSTSPVLSVARYDEAFELLWRTNLGSSFFSCSSLGRSIGVVSNGVVVCSLGGDLISRVAKLGANGSIHWMRDSIVGTIWSQLVVLGDGTVCVGGERSSQVFSSTGERLAMHGTWSFTSMSHPAAHADRFVVLDAQSRNLLQIDSDGMIRNIGQLPLENRENSPNRTEIVSVNSNEWLIAENTFSGGYPPRPNEFTFYCMESSGGLKWRQPFPGYAYADDCAPNHWLLRASDGTIRLVVNLTYSSANQRLGVAVTAFSVSGAVEGPVLTSQPPKLVYNGPDGVDVEVQAAGVGALRYQWYFNGWPPWNMTNRTAHIQAESNGVWTVKVQDDTGEIVSPGILVQEGDLALGFGGSDYSSLQLGVTMSYARQFRLEASTDLLHWTRSPVICSWLNYVPVNALPEIGLDGHFFRAVEVSSP